MENQQSKTLTSIALSVIAGLTITAFIAVLVYSYVDDRKSKKIQKRYQTEIKQIETYLNEGNCTQAALEYDEAKVTRKDIDDRGLYYSFNSHAKQAHAIKIAECFAKNKEFETAVRILDSEAGDDPDSLLRASAIYQSAGELTKAQEAKAKAKNF